MWIPEAQASLGTDLATHKEEEVQFHYRNGGKHRPSPMNSASLMQALAGAVVDDEKTGIERTGSHTAMSEFKQRWCVLVLIVGREM